MLVNFYRMELSRRRRLMNWSRTLPIPFQTTRTSSSPSILHHCTPSTTAACLGVSHQLFDLAGPLLYHCIDLDVISFDKILLGAPVTDVAASQGKKAGKKRKGKGKGKKAKATKAITHILSHCVLGTQTPPPGSRQDPFHLHSQSRPVQLVHCQRDDLPFSQKPSPSSNPPGDRGPCRISAIITTLALSFEPSIPARSHTEMSMVKVFSSQDRATGILRTSRQ